MRAAGALALGRARSAPGPAAIAALVLSLSLVAAAAVPTELTLASGAGGTTAEYLLDLYNATRARLLEIASMVEGAQVQVDVEVNASFNLSAAPSSTNATSATGNYTHAACANLMSLVEASIARGDELASQARAALEAGDYRGAASLALRAINSLTPAFVHVTICLNWNLRSAGGGNQTQVNATSPSHVPPGLMAAVTRHELRLSRLMAAAQAAEDAGMNVSGVEDFLEQAEELLVSSREEALAGNVTGASALMAEANRLMSQAARVLHTASARAAERKAARLCQQGGNCTLSVLNLTQVNPGVKKALEVRCRGLGVRVNLTFSSPPGLAKKLGGTGPGKVHPSATPGQARGHGASKQGEKGKGWERHRGEHPGQAGKAKEKPTPGHGKG